MLTELSSGRQYFRTYRAHYGTLGSGMSYSYSIQYMIPTRLPSGMYNVSVHTDFLDLVFEHNFGGNNILHRTFRIDQNLPDLVVSNFSFYLETTVQGNRMELNYTVTNQGSSPTERSWTDRIGFSHQQLYSSRDTSFLQYVHQSELNVGESRMQRSIISVPRHLFGTLYLHVLVDNNGRVLEENENNNVYTAGSFTVPAVFPDLSVTNFISNFSGDVFAGERLTLTWTVTNEGNGEVTSVRWTDAVYIDMSQEITSRSNTRISSAPSLLPSTSYTQSAIVQLPIELSGPYSLIVRANDGTIIDENDSLTNNYALISLYVNIPPSPDFRVIDVTFMYHTLDRILSAEWTVLNAGNSIRENMVWMDQVYLLADMSFNSRQALLVGTKAVTVNVLESEQQYTSSATIRLPCGILGTFYVHVEVDGRNNILEINGEDNNYGRSRNTVTIVQPPMPRLRIRTGNVELPTSIEAGQTLTVEYIVTNVGNGPLTLASWTDAVYLTTSNSNNRNEVLEDGILLTQLLINRELGSSESYTVSVNVTVPYGVNQQSYLAVIVDVNDNLDETVSNEDSGNLFEFPFDHSIVVEPGPLPDLTIIVSSSTRTLQGGQPATLMYDVENLGQGRADGIWYDSIFLSNDVLLDPFDTRLKTVRNMMNLEVNSSYSQTTEVFIPFDLPSAFYYIFYEVDSSHSIPDIIPDNNIGYQIVNVTEAISTDLEVTGVTFSPSDLHYGDGKLHTLVHVASI